MYRAKHSKSNNNRFFILFAEFVKFYACEEEEKARFMMKLLMLASEPPKLYWIRTLMPYSVLYLFRSIVKGMGAPI